MQASELKRAIREVPGFPRPDITYYDVSTLFRDGRAFGAAIERLVEHFRGAPLDALAGIEARGFVIGAALAYELGTGLIMVRKRGKLPAAIEGEDYQLEYGEGRLEVHRDAVTAGQRILIVDDLLATGGTAAAAARILERLGGRVGGFGFLVELSGLGGRAKLPGDVFSLVQYD